MTPAQIASLVGLAAIFAIALARRVNIGLVAFGATLILVWAAHVDASAVVAKFPAELVLLIVGVTLLFGHAIASGAVDTLLWAGIRVAGGRRMLMPWIVCVLGIGLATVGAFPSALLAVLIPIVARLAAEARISYMMMALMTALVTNAAGFSPLGTSGALVKTLAHDAHRHYSPWLLYALVLGAHVVLALIVYAIFSWRDRHAERPAAGVERAEPAGSIGSRGTGSIWYQAACAVAIVLLVVGTTVWKLDVGLAALTLSVILQLLFRTGEEALLRRVPWSVVLLVSGLLVYLAALTAVGTLKVIENGLGGLSNDVIALIAVVYVTALVSNVESSTLVVLGVVTPIGLALTATGTSSTAVLAVLFAISMSAASVVVSPVHVGGALTLANGDVQVRPAMFRHLLYAALAITAIIPIATGLFPLAVGV